MIVAVFWLSASAAWANGVLGLKGAADETWLTSSSKSPCQKDSTGYIMTDITECSQEDDQKGSFGGANASVVSLITYVLLIYAQVFLHRYYYTLPNVYLLFL